MRLLLVAVLAICANAAVAAETPPTRAPCFEVVPLPANPNHAALAVKIDRCSGQTWFLSLPNNGVMTWFPIHTTEKPN